jgi:hypothetical protein
MNLCIFTTSTSPAKQQPSLTTLKHCQLSNETHTTAPLALQHHCRAKQPALTMPWLPEGLIHIHIDESTLNKTLMQTQEDNTGALYLCWTSQPHIARWQTRWKSASRRKVTCQCAGLGTPHKDPTYVHTGAGPLPHSCNTRTTCLSTSCVINSSRQHCMTGHTCLQSSGNHSMARRQQRHTNTACGALKVLHL